LGKAIEWTTWTILLVSWPTKMFHPLSTVSVKEDPGHFIVIMLTRMYQNFIVPLSQFPADYCRLDELRTRPNDGNDFHDYLITPFCVRWNFQANFGCRDRCCSVDTKFTTSLTIRLC